MSRRWRILTALVIKDWQLLWSDRRAVLLGFCVPVILASSFGLLFDRPTLQGNGGSAVLPLMLVIEDGGPCTAAVVQGVLASPRLQVEVTDRVTAEAAVRRRRVPVAAVIPAGFETAAAAWSLLGQLGRRHEVPRLQLLHNGAEGLEVQWAAGVLTEVVTKQLVARQYGGQLPADAIERVALVQVVPISVAVRPQARFHVYTHSFCGMTLQYLLLWGMESGLLLLRERQAGAWRRLRAASACWSSLLAAKTLTTGGMGCLQVLVTFAFGWLVFDVRVQGSLTGFVLLLVAACLLSAATGLAVAAWGDSEARARNLSILVILGVSMLGGLWFPAFLLPEWVRGAALALPTAWAMEGLSAATWQGGSFFAVLPAIVVVSGFATVLLTIAVMRLWHLERRAA